MGDDGARTKLKTSRFLRRPAKIARLCGRLASTVSSTRSHMEMHGNSSPFSIVRIIEYQIVRLRSMARYWYVSIVEPTAYVCHMPQSKHQNLCVLRARPCKPYFGEDIRRVYIALPHIHTAASLYIHQCIEMSVVAGCEKDNNALAPGCTKFSLD